MVSLPFYKLSRMAEGEPTGRPEDQYEQLYPGGANAPEVPTAPRQSAQPPTAPKDAPDPPPAHAPDPPRTPKDAPDPPPDTGGKSNVVSSVPSSAPKTPKSYTGSRITEKSKWEEEGGKKEEMADGKLLEMNEIAQEEMGPEMAVSPAMEVGSVVGEVEEEAGDPVRDVRSGERRVSIGF